MDASRTFSAGAPAAPAAARSASLMRSQFISTSFGGARLRVREHVRMAAHDLGHHRGLHVREVEDARLRGVLRVEHDLEQQVAQLLGEVRRGRRPPARRTPRTTPPAGTSAAIRWSCSRSQGQPPGCPQARHQPRQPERARCVPAVRQPGQQVRARRRAAPTVTPSEPQRIGPSAGERHAPDGRAGRGDAGAPAGRCRGRGGPAAGRADTAARPAPRVRAARPRRDRAAARWAAG